MHSNRIFSTILSTFLSCAVAGALTVGTSSFAAETAPNLSKMDAEIAAQAAERQAVPAELKEVGITEHLGGSVSIQELNFRNEKGESVKLADYFHKGRPVIVNLVYYECPSLCSLVLNGFVKSLKTLQWTPGKEFDIVTVSIDSREGPALAAAKKEAYLKQYGREGAELGWHFLTGQEADIRKLADQVGFGYKWVEKDQQFAHSAALFMLTPEGKVSRYLYGIEYAARDMKLALLEASNGKVGSVIDRFLLFCYRYDPYTRKYSVYLAKVMQAGSAGTVVVFGGYLAVFWNRQRRKLTSLGNSQDGKKGV